jgi:hypothetical protein
LRKRAIAVALSMFGVALIWSTGASAALTELTVRIEGAEQTLFEGPIETEGHDVKAASDTSSRRCDATNADAHPEPGPTPTAASVDAMELAGEDFDGEWYPGFDDYFIQRWGPDRELAPAYWGILVNGVFTPVGGCQFKATAGDEVLWAYDAFNGRQLLWLSAADDLGFPAAPTAHVEVGEPLELKVESGEQPSTAAAAGIAVASVSTAAGSGYQTVEVINPAAVSTDAAGEASITFSTPGWHRIKAQKEDGFLRSNRLDICVEAESGDGCGALPADAAVRVAPRYEEGGEEEGEGGEESGENPPSDGGGDRDGTAAPTAAFRQPLAGAKPASAIEVRRPRLNRARGTATLPVAVPGPGRLVVSGGKLRKSSQRSAGPGVVRVNLRPTGRGRKALRETGRLKVTLTLRFTPAGGEPSASKRGLVLKLAGPRG